MTVETFFNNLSGVGWLLFSLGSITISEILYLLWVRYTTNEGKPLKTSDFILMKLLALLCVPFICFMVSVICEILIKGIIEEVLPNILIITKVIIIIIGISTITHFYFKINFVVGQKIRKKYFPIKQKKKKKV